VGGKLADRANTQYRSKDIQWPSDIKYYHDYQTWSQPVPMLLLGRPNELDIQAADTNLTAAGTNGDLN